MRFAKLSVAFRLGITALLTAVIAGMISHPAKADGITAVVQPSVSSQQTGGTTFTAPIYNSFLTAFDTTLGEFDSGSVTYPGPGSPASLTFFSGQVSGAPDDEWSLSSNFSTLADLDNAYPSGLYTFTLTNSITLASETASVDHSSDILPNALPALTAASYNSLQGMDPSVGLNINFNGFTPDPNANNSVLGLLIFRTNPFSIPFENVPTSLSPDMNSVFLPGGTLLPDTQYLALLIFENSSIRTSGVDTVEDVGEASTTISFTTGDVSVPAPGALALLGAGLAGLIAQRRRKAA